MDQNGSSTDVARPMSDQPAAPSADALLNAPASLDAMNVGPLGVPIPADVVVVPRKRGLWKWIALGVGVCALIAGGLVAVLHQNSNIPLLQAGTFNPVTLPLSGIEKSSLPTQVTHTLQVNGQLEVDGVILLPSTQPNNPKLGQLYYDKASNHLNYYNGQQFQAVGGGDVTNNITNIFNGTSAGPGNTTGAGVLLQGSTPGTQQIGNLNISGTAAVGTLQTTVINSNGGTLYVNPISNTAQQQVVVGTPATTGLNVVGSTVGTPGNGWHSDLSATKVTTGNVGGTADSIAVYFNGGSASDHVQVGLYADNGDIPGKPFSLLSSSASVALNPNGFTTVPIPSVVLNANTTYWLAVNTDSNNVGRAYNGGNKASCFVTNAYGFMPDPFNPFGCFYDNNTYSIYLNYTLGAGASGSLSQAQFALGATGQALFQNSTDSNTAFQIQNAGGLSTIFNVDTINGRVSIGKASASYKLDIAGGDANLSFGHSVRFGGLQALNSNGDGSITSITNFLPGSGKVAVQADGGFMVENANADHQDLTIGSNGAATFANRADSTAGFQIQNAAGRNVLTLDTANDQLILGNDGTAANVSVPSIRGGAASGNNLTGKNLTINAGNGTGTGGSGNIVFNTATGVSNPLVTLDNTGGNEGNSTALTWPHITGAHPDEVLIVAANAQAASTPATATSVTYNGIPLTLLANLPSTVSTGSVWYLVNPPTGSHTVSVTYSGNIVGTGGQSTTFYNVDQSNPIGAFATQTIDFGTVISTTLAGTNVGQVVYDALLSRQDIGLPTPDASQTLLFRQLSNNVNADSYKLGNGGSTTMSWSGSGLGSSLNHVVLALNPEPNVTPDPLSERFRVGQAGTGINLASTENAGYDLTFGGSADRTIGINQNPTTGNGHNLTIQAGGGAVGANNGGTLVLQGGLATGSGAPGAVKIQSNGQNGIAFTIAQSGGTAVAAYDTVFKHFGVNTTNTQYDLSFTSSYGNTIGVIDSANGIGQDLTLHAGNAGGAANNGGNVYLTGGNKTGASTGGAVIVKNAADSTAAFQIQNAAGSSTILSVDTTNKLVTVTNLAVTGHIISSGTTPGIAAGAAACTTPTVSVSGNDTSGIITVTTGNGCATSGTLATLTFASAFGSVPHIILTPGSSTALTLGAYVNDTTATTTSFVLGTNNTAVNTTTYKWNYMVLQ